MIKSDKDYDWMEGTLGGNYVYFEIGTGRIVGEVSKVGMTGSRSQASCYIDVNNHIYLGNYIDASWAKLAVERKQHWFNTNVDNAIDYEPFSE
jgi:hypothetical protein